MNQNKTISILALASIFAFRMLGLFMILPVFALYAHGLINATPTTIGVALGIYGLTQACLQIPFGMLSDKIGRKPMIVIGLIIFALGSIVAALAHSIELTIFGRALQGAGAIGSVIMALAADLTPEHQRTKAMAIIGLTIGTTFATAMVLGPLLNHLIGVPGIFWLTAMLALLGILILLILVPTPAKLTLQPEVEPVPKLFKNVLCNPQLLRLDFSIFSSHAILTAMFIAIPLLVNNTAGLAATHQWLLYLTVLVLSFIAMVPFIIVAEKYHKMKPVLLGAIIMLGLIALLFLFVPKTLFIIGSSLFFFFTAFTILEACLPSLVSKTAPKTSKGTAMGVYSTSQFLGIFIGGSVGGWLYGQFAFKGVFLFCAILAFLWFLTMLTMPNSPNKRDH